MLRRGSVRESDPSLRAPRFLIVEVIAIAAILVHAFGPATPAWADRGAFEGQVVDMETQEPIRGAVVLVAWGESPSVPGYLMIKIHDTDSVLTDKSGRFHIPGRRVDDLPKNARLASGVIIFKAGYGFVQIQQLETLAHMAKDRQKEDGPVSAYWDVRLKRGKPLLLLRKLNVRQMERDRPELLPSIPWSERKLLVWEITREQRAIQLGVTPDLLTEPNWADPTWNELEALLDGLETGFSEEVFLQRIQAGDLRAVELFLEGGIEKNFKDSRRRTALAIAVTLRNADITRALLRAGADVAIQDDMGRTALDQAAQDGVVDLVKLLLDHGAKVGQSRFPKRGALWSASKKGHLAVVRLLLEKGGVDKAVGLSGLLVAAESDQRPIVEALLDHGIDINGTEEDRRTALMIAAAKAHLDMIALLLKRRADTEAKDGRGLTVLLIESATGREELVNALLNGGADVNARSLGGDGCLSAAAKGGHVRVVRLLLKHGAAAQSDPQALVYAGGGGHLEVVRVLLDNGLTATSHTGTQALTAAAEGGHRPVLELLIARGGDVNAKAPGGWPPLVGAAMGGRLDIAQFLVDRGAQVRSEAGDTALTAAAGRGHADVVRFLLNREANAESNAGAPALAFAAEIGHLPTVRVLLDERPRISAGTKTWALSEAAAKGHLDVVRLLLDRGAPADGDLGTARRPLFDAIRNVTPEPYRKTVIENGVKQEMVYQPMRGGLIAPPPMDSPGPSVRDARPTTVERVAEVIGVLLDRGADVNAKNRSGQTVLMLASEYGAPSVTKLLLARGADPRIRDQQNRTALSVAKKHGRDDIAAVLKAAGAMD